MDARSPGSPPGLGEYYSRCKNLALYIRDCESLCLSDETVKAVGPFYWIEQWLTDRRQRVVVDGEVSNWKPVLSGVPQGSVLGPISPILFLIYINHLEEGVTSKILKFADDTKLFRKIKGNWDKQQLQDDIDKLIKWSEKWQMLFNFQKCKCLHAGHGNTGVNYEMGGTILCQTVKEKDLG